MSTNQYYILWRGQTTGPFTFDQIKQQLDQGRISLSHQVNDGGNLIFVEDFLDEKQAEVDQIKAEQEAMAAEAKAQAEHARQKELLQIQSTAAVAQAEAAAAGAMPMPNMPGQPQSTSGSSDVVGVILAILIIIGVGVGGYFAYNHFSGPSVGQIEADVKADIQAQWITSEVAALRSATITDLTLVKESENKYTGFIDISFPDGSSLRPAINVTVDGERFLWKIDID